jgi:CRP-like cAMP-binding protein
VNKAAKQSGARMNLEDRLDLLQITGGLSKMSRSELLPLAKIAKERLYPRNQYIFHEDDPATEFHVVASGRVRLCKLSAQGKIFTTMVADRGYTLNAVTLFDSSPRFLSAQAMEDSLIVHLPKDVFVSFVAGHPAVALEIITLLGRGTKSIFERTLDIVAERVEQRVINILLMLYSKYGDTLRLTNRELADMAGTTTETAIRVMGQLSKDGMIQTSRGRVRIISPDLLQTLGRGPFWG